MVTVKPFKGFHYDFTKLSMSPEKLVAPPYDVISDEMLKALKSEPLNICNVMLGNRNDGYAHASETLRKWVESGKIVKDEKEGFYVYEQVFKLEGRIYQRLGIVALLELEPLGKNILPHEMTHPKVTQDRLALLSAINANIEQIFMVYEDKEYHLRQILERTRQPSNEVIDFTDSSDVRHRIFRINRDSDISEIIKTMRGKKALIADGHHRYETALQYSQQMDKKEGKGSHDFVLVTLVNDHDVGLIMLPTHRLISSIDQKKLDSLQEKLSKKFDVDIVEDKVELIGHLEGMEGCGIIGFWYVKKDVGLITSLKPEFCKDDPVEKLDVAILHKQVLEDILDITPEMQERREKIQFVKGTEEVFKEAANKGAQLICLLNASSIPEIFAAAETGRKLPHKATYFYPKLWSGLIMYVF